MDFTPESGGQTIDWKEIIGPVRSPRIRLEWDRSSAVRTVDIPWDYSVMFAEYVIGDHYQHTDDTNVVGSGWHIKRSLPWTLNFDNTDEREPFLYATSVDIEGLGVPDDSVCYTGDDKNAQARYAKARCTVNFATRTYRIISDSQLVGEMSSEGSGFPDESFWKRYITRLCRPQTEVQTVQIGGHGNAYFYAGLYSGNANNKAEVPIAAGINKLLSSVNLSVTWHQIPEDAVPSRVYNPDNTNFAIDNCLGRVNDREFNGFKKGTLLLLAVELKPMMSPFGRRFYDITYMFKFAQRSSEFALRGGQEIYPGHNHVFLPPIKRDSYSSNPPNDPPEGWYEAVAQRTTALNAPWTNFIVMEKGVNIFDFANMANLFRPSKYVVSVP